MPSTRKQVSDIINAGKRTTRSVGNSTEYKTANSTPKNRSAKAENSKSPQKQVQEKNKISTQAKNEQKLKSDSSCKSESSNLDSSIKDSKVLISAAKNVASKKIVEVIKSSDKERSSPRKQTLYTREENPVIPEEENKSKITSSDDGKSSSISEADSTVQKSSSRKQTFSVRTENPVISEDKKENEKNKSVDKNQNMSSSSDTECKESAVKSEMELNLLDSKSTKRSSPRKQTLHVRDLDAPVEYEEHVYVENESKTPRGKRKRSNSIKMTSCDASSEEFEKESKDSSSQETKLSVTEEEQPVSKRLKSGINEKETKVVEPNKKSSLETFTPRRSGRGVVPNRKFRDMEVEITPRRRQNTNTSAEDKKLTQKKKPQKATEKDKPQSTARTESTEEVSKIEEVCNTLQNDEVTVSMETENSHAVDHSEKEKDSSLTVTGSSKEVIPPSEENTSESMADDREQHDNKILHRESSSGDQEISSDSADVEEKEVVENNATKTGSSDDYDSTKSVSMDTSSGIEKADENVLSLDMVVENVSTDKSRVEQNDENVSTDTSGLNKNDEVVSMVTTEISTADENVATGNSAVDKTSETVSMVTSGVNDVISEQGSSNAKPSSSKIENDNVEIPEGCGQLVYEDENGLVTEVVTIRMVEGAEADAIVGVVQNSGDLSLEDVTNENSDESKSNEINDSDRKLLQLIELEGFTKSGKTSDGEKEKDGSQKGESTNENRETQLIKVKILGAGESDDSEGKIITIPHSAKSGMSTSSTQTPIISSRFAELPGKNKKGNEKDTVPKLVAVNLPRQSSDGAETSTDNRKEFVIVHLPEGTPVMRHTIKRDGKDEAIPYYQNETGSYVCGLCNYSTPKKANWYKHKNKHLLQKHHQCPKCHYKAATSSNLKRHLAIHDDVRGFQCSVCMLSFRQKIHLERHIRYRHEEKRIKCPLCDYVCANENPDLKVHIKRRHLPEEGDDGTVQIYSCEECGLEAVSKKDLRQHMKFHRQGPELKLYCEHCSFVTDCDSRLRRHMYIHTNEKPFQCGLCSYRGTQKEHVIRHMKTQHDIMIQKKMKPSADDSSAEGSNDDSPIGKTDKLDYSAQEKIFACNHCSMKFAKLLNLYKHLHSQHKSILPAQRDDEFLCVVCDYRTCSKKNLLVHMRKHNVMDQGPPSHVYSCVLCHYLNPKRRNLFQHMKKKHNIEIVMKEDGSTSCFMSSDGAASLTEKDESVQNILTVGDVVTTSSEEPQLQIMTEDGVNVQNVISIEDLAYAVSHPQPNNQSNLVILEQALSGITQVSSQSGAVVQQDAVEAIEGLQALAEQPGIVETQEIITDPEHPGHITIDAAKSDVMETEVITMGTEITSQTEVEAASPAANEETDGQSNLQLSAEQLMDLSTGDYVEINGEMYKVEIAAEENAIETENQSENNSETVQSTEGSSMFLQKIESSEIVNNDTEVGDELTSVEEETDEKSSTEIMAIQPENVFTIDDTGMMESEIPDMELVQQEVTSADGPSNVMTVIAPVDNSS